MTIAVLDNAAWDIRGILGLLREISSSPDVRDITDELEALAKRLEVLAGVPGREARVINFNLVREIKP